MLAGCIAIDENARRPKDLATSSRAEAEPARESSVSATGQKQSESLISAFEAAAEKLLTPRNRPSHRKGDGGNFAASDAQPPHVVEEPECLKASAKFAAPPAQNVSSK